MTSFLRTTARSFMGLAFCISLGGCAAQYSHVESVGKVEILRPTQLAEYKIQPGDILDVKFFYSPELNENVTVRPDGRISLQLVDDVMAAGLTIAELDAALTSRYSAKLPSEADVSVIAKHFADQRIYITGEILRGGELDLKNQMSILQAVSAAGGFTTDANRDTVLVIRQQDYEKPKVLLAKLGDTSVSNSGEEGTYAMLMPRDIIYIPKSGIAKVNLFMDQYVRDMLLFNGFSAGLTGVYELNNKDAEMNDNTTVPPTP